MTRAAFEKLGYAACNAGISISMLRSACDPAFENNVAYGLYGLLGAVGAFVLILDAISPPFVAVYKPLRNGLLYTAVLWTAFGLLQIVDAGFTNWEFVIVSAAIAMLAGNDWLDEREVREESWPPNS